MNPYPYSILQRWLPCLFFLGFSALVVFLTLHTDRATRSFSACAVPPDTIPGIPEPRFFLENDSYVWLSHARDLLNSGDWRLRHTYMDNAPYGRPMHWSHLLLWTILGGAKAIMAVTHWPPARAIELAGVWAMPFWHIVFLALLFFALPRRIGLLPTILLALLTVTNECIAIVAFPLKPDHHIFQMAFGIAFFLCLQRAASAGLPAPAIPPSERLPLCRFPLPPDSVETLRAATAAGIFLGLLYWIGATVAFFVLALSAFSVLPLLPCFRTPIPKISPFPQTLWRRFAISAITVAAFFWLLEYAPAHFSMRLEVNHPLHWLPIAGVAVGLAALSSLPRRPRFSDFFSPRLLFATILCASLPLAIAFGPVSWHQLKAPILARLHQTYIFEFLHGNPTPTVLLSTYRIPALALFATPVVLLFGKRLSLPPRARPILLSSLVFALFFLAAATWQIRWGYLCATAIYSLATLLCLALLETAPGRISRFCVSLVLLAAALSFADAFYAIHCRLRLESGIADASSVPDDWIRCDMYKRISLRLAARKGTNRWVFAGIPSDAPSFYYYASIPSLASFYWENLPGWQAETAIMADTSPGFANALSIARDRGITHFLSATPSDAPLVFHHVATGVSNRTFAASRTFCGHLTHTQLFERLPPVLLDDSDFNDAIIQRVVFRTPSGYAQGTSHLHLFTLPPASGASDPTSGANPRPGADFQAFPSRPHPCHLGAPSGLHLVCFPACSADRLPTPLTPSSSSTISRPDTPTASPSGSSGFSIEPWSPSTTSSPPPCNPAP